MLRSFQVAALIVGIAALFTPVESQAQKSRRSAARFNRPISALVTNSSVFNQAHSGFVLFDPVKGVTLQQRNADKFFTPASNTKIFTLHTALQILGDSLPVLRYLDMGDTLVFWGTGHPGFLHPDLPADSIAMSFLKSRPEKLFFTDFNFRDDHFGPGWSWADYTAYYQPERSPMPIYGNAVLFRSLGADSGFVAFPGLFRDSLVYEPQLEAADKARIQREERGNLFRYNATALRRAGFEEETPIDMSTTLLVRMLSDTLRRSVGVLDANMLPAGSVNTLYSPVNDTLYMRLMRNSDNFVAEQLLLMCSEALYNIQTADKAIAHARERLFAGSPDRMEWWDGSGLSRYNAFTPRTVVYALHQLYKTQPLERLLQIFPAGGVSGTIRGWYGARAGRQPFVYAKTGSLRYVHCLSGFVQTRKGKTLIFSFMHNNFTANPDDYREEMQGILRRIWEVY
jgi:D-alanyl-D-alanine carboxypeptidase/D-alanyl-D-alanine-endopeptidase (penicillin-binding protein 4)